MSLASAALRRPVTTVAITLGVLLLGAVSLGRLPVALLPDVALPVLTIRTAWPAAAAPEISRFIAEPVEEAVAATPGLIELRSVSRNGEAMTIARFAWGTDMRTTVLEVRERLDNARSRLPQSAERPTLLTSDPGERPIAVLALTGPGDLRAVAQAARDVHARRLEQLPGVASVAVVGAPEEEIAVEVDPGKLRALNLTAAEVATAIRNANAAARGGTVRRGQFRFSVRALTEFAAADEIAATPVGSPQLGLRLSQVATITPRIADPATLVRSGGQPGLGLVIYKDAGANTVAVTREIERVQRELAAEFPRLQLATVAAQAGFVTAALSNLGQEILLGAVLSLLIILLMLGDLRGSLAVGLMIPISVLVSLTVLQIMGVTINVLSLGGLALAVGLLVDNAIVVAEAANRNSDAGMERSAAVRAAAADLSGPLIAGTLTTILVFGPIIFVRGLAAALFRDLSLSVIVSLSASLLLALTLLPVMLAGRTSRNRMPEGLRRIGTRAADGYESAMRWFLRRPRVTALGAVALTATGVLSAMAMPKEILPRVDEGMVVAALRLPDGTSIEETTRQAARLERAAAALGSPRVYSRIGVATDEEVLAGADAGTAGSAQLLLAVPPGQEAAGFAQQLRDSVPDLAGGALALDMAGQTEFGALIGREGRIVRVEISAPAVSPAEVFAERVAERLRDLRTLADVRQAYAGRQPVVELSLRRDRIAARGLTPETVADALAGGLGGIAASDLRTTDRRTPIAVRFAGSDDQNLDAALGALVAGVPARQLVEVHESSAPTEVVRIDQRPVVVVEAVVERGGTARAARDVARAVGRLDVPQGVTWRLGGADAERRRTSRELLLAAVLAAALVYLVLAGEFASFRTPLLVMLTVPLAAVGGLLALWITGQSLNAVALIGLIVMVGLADNEAVVKLDAIRRFREAGHTPRDAAILGGRQRLRAITMTSLTTIVGVLPLVLGLGSGGELYQPLAAAVIGGSVTVLLVTFFLLPVAYVAAEEAARRSGG